jgi:hypothetical protein
MFSTHPPSCPTRPAIFPQSPTCFHG